jgi:Bacterial aa3 type cytochrome c oxidase subunit IV
MANHHAPEFDPKELENAQKNWHAFVQGGKYFTIATIVVLVGLALAFVKFI